MKIDYAIMASDNSHYLDFWPTVSYLWEEKFGIVPILLYFGEEKIYTHYGAVVNMGVTNDNIGIKACWARYWYASQLGNKVGIITDIDMIPLSKDYFVTQLEKYTNDTYVHLNDCISTYSRLPSCYHVASGSSFKEVLKINTNFYDSLKELFAKNYNNKECYNTVDNMFWCYDEFWATEHILMSEKKNIVLLKRDMENDRIDRTNWVWDANKKYVDCHSLRPFKNHYTEISKVIQRYND